MLENKVGMIFGVANQRSIAWACAQACAANGAKLAFTYQGERLKENVEKLTKDMDGALVIPCDVTNQAEVDAAFTTVEKEFGKLDFLIHSIAFAPKEALEGEFLMTSREAFTTALEISAFSLPQLAHHCFFLVSVMAFCLSTSACFLRSLHIFCLSDSSD